MRKKIIAIVTVFLGAMGLSGVIVAVNARPARTLNVQPAPARCQPLADIPPDMVARTPFASVLELRQFLESNAVEWKRALETISDGLKPRIETARECAAKVPGRRPVQERFVFDLAFKGSKVEATNFAVLGDPLESGPDAAVRECLRHQVADLAIRTSAGSPFSASYQGLNPFPYQVDL